MECCARDIVVLKTCFFYVFKVVKLFNLITDLVSEECPDIFLDWVRLI